MSHFGKSEHPIQVCQAAKVSTDMKFGLVQDL